VNTKPAAIGGICYDGFIKTRAHELFAPHLGRILGIPVSLDYSWFLIFRLLSWTLAGSYYPAEFKHWPLLLYWFMGALTAIMLFVSVLLHELG
jgi:hypothetical protein